ncbi:MAG: efflux RND transporter periplasmic adaptor subunit [Gammaproteobacteria bacterium]|nr:efflux RND transporter periplasmic adaptor subunit [Gammaproteobacteria bacterium]
MNLWKHISIFVVLTGSAALSGCGTSAASSADATAESTVQASIPVGVKRANRGDIFARHTGTSVLEADFEAPVVAKVEGDLVEILIEEGDMVKAGQVVARLDGERLKLAMERAGAEYRRAKKEYDRNQNLLELDLVAPGTFENLKYEAAALKAAYEIARLNYSYTEVKAPIDGVVAERLVKTGNHLQVNQQLFIVTDTSQLILELHVPQQNMSRFGVGQTADIKADALPGEMFDAIVERISPSIDRKTGTFRVTLRILDQSGDLRPGMFARVAVVYDVHNNAVMVPADAILDEDIEKSLFVIEDGVARRRIIETGITDHDMVEILEGIDDSDTVVVIGQGGLRDGTPVTEYAG